MAETNQDAIDIEELQRRGRPREEGDMDMTPMVDVTFLLLIFFTVTAAFALQKSLEIPPTQDESSASQSVEDLEKDSLLVRVDGDNVFWIGAPMWAEEQRAPSMTDMRSKVREARKGGGRGAGPAKMLVQAHGDATHEHVVAALDAGTSVGMDDIRLMSYEDGDL